MKSIETVLMKLFSGFPNTAITETTVLVYAERLQDMDLPTLETVVNQCIEECKFLPTIAEIRERLHALSGGLTADTAAEAWGSVQKAIVGVGRAETPRFRDPLVARVVGMMGWRNLCDSESPAGVDRAQFMRMYSEIAEREQRIARLNPAARAMLESHTPAHKLITVDGMAAPRLAKNGH